VPIPENREKSLESAQLVDIANQGLADFANSRLGTFANPGASISERHFEGVVICLESLRVLGLAAR
jgi:hypothetical protein